MGALKLIISYFMIAMAEYSMRNESEWKADPRIQFVFEIAASILCAAWIMHEGW